MRLIILCVSLFVLTASAADALTLYNSQDPKGQAASAKASEQLNRAFSKMFEALAVVERRTFDDAEKLKGEAARQFLEAATLFIDTGRFASDEKVVPVPRDDEDKQIIRRMMELSKFYKTTYNDHGEFSEKYLFDQIGRVLREFAEELAKVPMSGFAGGVREQRMTSQILLRAIRLQDFGRVTTAYLAIPRSR